MPHIPGMRACGQVFEWCRRNKPDKKRKEKDAGTRLTSGLSVRNGTGELQSGGALIMSIWKKILAVAAVCGALLFLLAKGNVGESDVRGSGSSDSGARRRAAERPAVEAGRAVAGLSERYREFLCETPECASNPFMASSREEAIWLASHGYPAPGELDSWRNLSNDQLRRVAEGGSLAAKAVYGERIALQGDMAGLDYLLDAARNGSIYSYYGTSAVVARRNMFEAAAFLRVAYVLGDRRASEVMVDRFPRLGSVDHDRIDRRAAELYRSYAKERRPELRP